MQFGIRVKLYSRLFLFDGEKKVWGKLLAILNTGLEMLGFIFEIFVELFSHDEYLEIIVFFVISLICNIVI